MPDISITVTDKRPVCTAGTTVVCDNSDYIVHWDLDAEWSAYDSKTMRVIYMDGTYTDTVFTGASVALPPVPVPGCVQIGLYAGDIHTSRMALLHALSSVRSASGAPAYRVGAGGYAKQSINQYACCDSDIGKCKLKQCRNSCS